jgi:glycosyltransferase involved in cell wall biosynthesis
LKQGKPDDTRNRSGASPVVVLAAPRDEFAQLNKARSPSPIEETLEPPGRIPAAPRAAAHPLRVLHTIHSLSGGGAETQLCLLLNSWPYPEIENGVFFVAGNGSEITNPAARRLPSRQKSTRHVGFLHSMLEAISRFDPDIIHIWQPEVVSIPAMLFGRLKRRKIILSYRGPRTLHRKRAYIEACLAIVCVDSIVSNHEVLTAPSYASSVFRWLFERKRGQVIRNGVAVEAVHTSPESSQKGPGFLFICVGRLTPQKNYLRLVEALKLLADRPEWSLDIWGEGESREEIEGAAAAAGLSDRIRLRGFSSAVTRAMQQACALILPSVYEGMPNVLLEAMALGVPVIAADIEGIREVVGNDPACVWINPLDPRDIARGISAVLDETVDRATLIERGQQVAARYSVATAQAAYLDLYRNLVNEP